VSRFTIILLAVVVVAACGFATAAAPPKTTASAKPNPDPARFTADIAAFEAWDRQNSAPKDAVLFVGSSSIRLWPTADSFPDLPVINRGFGGSHTSDVIHFADRIVLKYAPRTIVFYAGDNDVADGKPPEQVAADFAAFAKLVHAKQPETRIIYLPIKPSIARLPIWPKAQATNDLVKQFVAGNERLEYIDTATPMLGSDGRPRPEIFLSDGLHVNAAGYTLWTEILADKLADR
jgi:lysophospholipase L1-like esterase